MTIKFFEVGGCIRDEFLGVKSKDVDFAVVAPSFDAMRDHLTNQGFKIYIEKPEFLTIRAGVPKSSPLSERTSDADFVLARKDGPSSDNRRPDFVEPGDILDDLARRDFTVNAIARNPISGELIDPHGGIDDCRNKVLRFVGDPMERIREDGLRVMRGLRFIFTKDFYPTADTLNALISLEAAALLKAQKIERIYEELKKMFDHDMWGAYDFISGLPSKTLEAIMRDGLKLRIEPSLKKD